MILLYHILNVFFSIIIIVLFIRYFVERYQYYGFGPIMVAIIQITEKIIKPIKQLLPRGAYTIQEQTPLLAILVTILLRGIVIWVVQFSSPMAVHSISPLALGGGLLPAMALSLTMGIMLLGEMLIAFLFASIMITRRGVTMSGNAGFMCFQEKTFAIFRITQKYVKTDNLLILFCASGFVILLSTSLLAATTNFSWMLGLQAFLLTIPMGMVAVIGTLVNVYMFVLILAIVASWVGADQYSAVIQIVRSMADPYLGFFRRWFPWAKIDFIDLSPIFGFLVLTLVIPSLIQAMQLYLKQLISAGLITGW
jgi:YggT family protein